jgi:hypothetical protein
MVFFPLFAGRGTHCCSSLYFFQESTDVTDCILHGCICPECYIRTPFNPNSAKRSEELQNRRRIVVWGGSNKRGENGENENL